MPLWTAQQWGTFVTVLAAGLLAALLINIKMRLLRPTPAPVRAVGRVHVDPTADVLAHVAPGPGSLTSLQEVEGSITVAEPLVDKDISDALADALGRALEDFRVGVEPAMRKARLWTLQGGETYAENALRTWHIMEITGEIPNPFARRGLDGARA